MELPAAASDDGPPEPPLPELVASDGRDDHHIELANAPLQAMVPWTGMCEECRQDRSAHLPVPDRSLNVLGATDGSGRMTPELAAAVCEVSWRPLSLKAFESHFVGDEPKFKSMRDAYHQFDRRHSQLMSASPDFPASVRYPDQHRKAMPKFPRWHAAVLSRLLRLCTSNCVAGKLSNLSKTHVLLARETRTADTEDVHFALATSGKAAHGMKEPELDLVRC